MTYIKAIELLDALQRMLDEYEQMNMEVKAMRSALKEEKEKLAEVEKERDDLNRHVCVSPKHTCLPPRSDMGECPACSVGLCPYSDADHLHHDGCPSCFLDAKVGKSTQQTAMLRLLSAKVEKADKTQALAGPSPAVTNSSECPACEGVDEGYIPLDAKRIADEVLAGNANEGALRRIANMGVASTPNMNEETQRFCQELEKLVLTAREALREIEARKVKP